MIGLDTNVLVRYIVQDDPQQSPEATALIESLSAKAPGFVSVVSVVELVWVLSSCYGSTQSEIYGVLETLLRTKELVVEQADIVWKALWVFRAGKADFADCLIERAAHVAGCSHTLTFDVDVATHGGMQLVN